MDLMLNIVAGLIHALGYFIYIKAERESFLWAPNPTTWTIFSFDTAVLTMLEIGAGAEIKILIVPIVCSLGALFVALILYKRGKLGWPKDLGDRIVLITAVLVMVGYTATWFLSEKDFISKELKFLMVIIFLIFSNLNTVISFIPTLRNPKKEYPKAWFVWTIAYLLLFVGTFLSGERNFFLYLYPVSCLILHFLVGVLSIRNKQKRHF